MATHDEVQQGLLDTIKLLAEAASKASSATSLTAQAEAARNLAEAHAWLSAPTQPH